MQPFFLISTHIFFHIHRCPKWPCHCFPIREYSTQLWFEVISTQSISNQAIRNFHLIHCGCCQTAFTLAQMRCELSTNRCSDFSFNFVVDGFTGFFHFAVNERECTTSVDGALARWSCSYCARCLLCVRGCMWPEMGQRLRFFWMECLFYTPKSWMAYWMRNCCESKKRCFHTINEHQPHREVSNSYV